jgi:SP family general alpha glucoside:H+ symporter-like MFS transporter
MTDIVSERTGEDIELSKRKSDLVQVERTRINDVIDNDALKPSVPTMRSQEDDLSVWETAKRYRLVVALGMATAFSASLDGYR